MRLCPSPKVLGHGAHRVVSPEQTFERAREIARRAGVTRLSDITGLDRIGIPVYSAVAPKSRDTLSIYNGKGATKIDAACGALMEAIERQSALAPQGRIVRGTLAEVGRSTPALDPASLAQLPHPKYTADTALQWLEGWELASGSPVLVPARIAGCCTGREYGPPCVRVHGSNGLASGNVIEEAICHALCEVIERDSWTIAELLAQWLPRWRRQQRGETVAPGECVDDIARYPEVDLSECGGAIRWMLRRFARAGLEPRVKDITSDLGVPTMFATVIEDGIPDLAMAHCGAGAHPDAGVAVQRALSEVAQSRAVDIQGVREDITQPDDVATSTSGHTKRLKAVDRRNWYHCPAPAKRPFAAIPSAIHCDILDDIRFMIGRLAAKGMAQVIAVDLTDPNLQVPVVRVIVPGLESWVIDHERVGDRALAQWLANE